MSRGLSGSVAGALALALLSAACKGDQGSAGPPGPPGGVDGGADGGTASGVEPGRLYAKIVSASIPGGGSSGGAPTLTYRLYQDAAYTIPAGTCAGGANGFDKFSPNFTAAKLVADPNNSGTQRWQSYINRNIGSIKVAATEGSHDTVAGTLTDNGDGSCTYAFQSDLGKAVAPGSAAAVTETYDPAAVTRLGMQNNPTRASATNPAFDGWIDVAPGGGALQQGNARALVADDACNQCHRDLPHHGAKRFSTAYCVTCHNPGTPDPCVASNTGSGCNPTSSNSTSLDLGVLVHKIHMGSRLASLSGLTPGGAPIAGSVPGGTLVINGSDAGEAGQAWSAITFPQDPGNCTVCHSLSSGTGSDYWRNQPSREACGACHDRVDFDAGNTGTPLPGFYGHPGTAAGQAPDGSCAGCHADGKADPVVAFHHIGITPAAQQLQVLKVVSATVKPGQKPTVTFLVTDPASNDAPVDVTTDARWNSGAASRLFVDIGWSSSPGEDWTNQGSGAVTGFGSIAAAGSPAPGQPLSFDAVAAAKAGTKNGDGSFTVTGPSNVDAGATGSGVVVLEGHPAVGGAEIPVTTATLPVAITDASAVARRAPVDIQKCDKCHGFLSLHGGNRNDNLQACVVCHNTEATDVTQRKGTSIDDKAEQSIQFAVLVHGIHAGAEAPFTQGIVVYAFTGAAPGAGSPNPSDFRDVKFPAGNSVGRCVMCHVNPDYPTAQTGVVNGVAVSTLVDTGSAISADQTKYLRTTPIAGVCSSCHQSGTATAHMAQNGAVGFATVGTNAIAAPGKTEGDILSAGTLGLAGAETCIVCHGPGAIADPSKFHGH